jgi:hypothetical protein
MWRAAFTDLSAKNQIVTVFLAKSAYCSLFFVIVIVVGKNPINASGVTICHVVYSKVFVLGSPSDQQIQLRANNIGMLSLYDSAPAGQTEPAGRRIVLRQTRLAGAVETVVSSDEDCAPAGQTEPAYTIARAHVT